MLKLIRQHIADNLARPAAFRRLCVETLFSYSLWIHLNRQPPSGGCVLKHTSFRIIFAIVPQPPSGGCVLKQVKKEQQRQREQPAAFRRLCVETFVSAGSRLWREPAAFRRLCVETTFRFASIGNWASSRLQAAVC